MQTLIQAWLDSQCAQIAGIASGVVMMMPRGGSGLAPAAAWPQGGRPGDELQAAALAAYERREAPGNGAERPNSGGTVLSYPIEVKGMTVGAMAVRLAPDVTLPPHHAMDSVKRGVDGFESFIRHGLVPGKGGSSAPPPSGPAVSVAPASAFAPTPCAPSTPPSQPTAPRDDVGEKTAELPASNSARLLHLLATIEAHEDFHAAAAAFATELAGMFDCDRVSIGFSGRRHIKVEALSHSSEFRTNQGLLRDIGAAMEEAIWQGATLMFPQPDGAQPRVDRAHTTLAQRHGVTRICTVPLVRSGKPVGAVTLERNRNEALPRTEVTFCENVATLLGPTMDVRREVGRPWPAKLLGAIHEGATPLFGPGHRTFQIAAASALLFLVSAAFIPGSYRVSAPARLEGAIQRVLAAPADGYLKLAHARPGDVVKAGQMLAELADEDLKLELRKAQSDVMQLENAYGDALARQDRAQVAVLHAKLEEAKAELALAQEQLKRTHLAAPFDGVLISGDLSQSLGAPVKKGDVLMTVAPEHDFRVILEVDEREVAELKIGQRGSLALSALPGDTLSIVVQRITPVATAAQGRNYFEVEARVDAPRGELRPGLLGVGKVDAGSRPLLWIWTHRVWDWARLTLWSWIG